jgi:hypothetical protein
MYLQKMDHNNQQPSRMPLRPVPKYPTHAYTKHKQENKA